jgi:hypothetical protein
MSKFNHIREQRIKGDKTVEYFLDQISVNGKTPVLVVRPATEANKPYFNAQIKRSARTARRVSSGKITAAVIEQNRNEDRDLFPQHVIVDWRNVCDGEGNPVPFSKPDCADFLDALPDWVFDDLRNFCSAPGNFSPELEEIDPEAVGKN